MEEKVVKNKMVSIPLNQADYKVLFDLAVSRGVKVSSFARGLLLQAISRELGELDRKEVI
jgi:hypothetical protein